MLSASEHEMFSEGFKDISKVLKRQNELLERAVVAFEKWAESVITLEEVQCAHDWDLGENGVQSCKNCLETRPLEFCPWHLVQQDEMVSPLEWKCRHCGRRLRDIGLDLHFKFVKDE